MCVCVLYPPPQIPNAPLSTRPLRIIVWVYIRGFVVSRFHVILDRHRVQDMIDVVTKAKNEYNSLLLSPNPMIIDGGYLFALATYSVTSNASNKCNQTDTFTRKRNRPLLRDRANEMEKRRGKEVGAEVPDQRICIYNKAITETHVRI